MLCGKIFYKGCLNVDAHQGMNLDGIDMTGKAVVSVHKVSCHKPLCPICWKEWASRECSRAVQRINAFNLIDHGGRKMRPIHIAVSVPHSDYGLSLEALRRKVYASLKRCHCIGGMLIFHSKRREKDTGIWYYSPHFHVIGYGWIVDTHANYVYSGYVVKNLRVRQDLGGTIYYQLSHCTVASEHSHSITWFGALGYRKLRVRYRVEDPENCPLCGAELKELVWIGEGECLVPPLMKRFFYEKPDFWEGRFASRIYSESTA